jgi:O-antigen/teichoic acid export membrane protein
MSRTNRFLGGLGFGYLQQILVLVIGLWLTPFFLLRLGQHRYGLWLIITQIAAYLGLLDLGVVGLLPRETAFAVGRGGVKSPELRLLIAQTARIVLVQWPVVLIFAAAAWLIVRGTWTSTELALEVILLTFVLMFPLRLFAAVLQGLQDLAFLAQVQIVGWIAGTLTAVALVLSGRGLIALAFSWAISQIVPAVLCRFRLWRNFPGVLPNDLGRFDRPAALTYFRKGAWISTSQVAQILTAGTDVLLIGKLLGPSATVPYSCTGKLAGVLANKPQMMMQAAFPALSELRTSGSRAAIRQATTALRQAVLVLSGAVACVVLAVNRGFIDWWVGADQFGGALLTLLIVGSMLMRHWNTTFIYSLFCFGYERRLAITGVAEGCVSIIASAILVSTLGVVGAPIGMLMGTCLVSLPITLIALAREVELSPLTILLSSMNWAARFALAAATGIVIAAVWNPRGFLSVAMLAVVVGILYMFLELRVLLQEPLGAYVRLGLRFLPSRLHRIFPVPAD